MSGQVNPQVLGAHRAGLAGALLALTLALGVWSPTTAGEAGDALGMVGTALAAIPAEAGPHGALGSVLGQSGATLTVSPPSVGAGGIVTASWSGIGSPTSTDWIGLYQPGSPPQGYLAWRYTTGAASGSVPFQLPSTLAPGTYELRLLANNGYTVLAVSNAFTLPSLSASPPSLAPGGVVTATWSGITNPSADDWLSLYPVGAVDSSFNGSFVFTGGTAGGQLGYQLPSDLPVGAYEVRLFANATWLRLAVSNAFTLPTLSVAPIERGARRVANG